ncbi:hypothetical protein PMAYCL1PPCAC_09602 [Pristionchus mayeri]|uniref:Uncharacterized protein n=1 Tax=Pristionchus mayeri TaxID=1317129 RepID=A0AAN5CDE7_9BILA|nr:hypothetical protein PMAYCL1PPCAC_09602 [Pristionchus mayeri]
MANDAHALKVTRKEILPQYTRIRQTDDGRIFYWHVEKPMRLYVKWNGKEIDVKLPAEQIWNVTAHGNGVYFKSNKKVIDSVLSKRFITTQNLDFQSDFCPF